MNDKQLSKGEEKFLKKALKNMSKEELAQLAPHMALPARTGKKLSTKDGMQMLREFSDLTKGNTSDQTRELLRMQGIDLP